MRTTAVVASILAQLKKFLDVQMPCFQICAYRALPFAPLVDCNGGVIGDLQEWHHALRFAVGALDVCAHRTHGCPVVAKTAGVFGQKGVFLYCFKDTGQVVRHGSKVAGRKLRTDRPGVEQGRCRTHEIEARQQMVELDSARVAITFPERQSHSHAHEKCLWQLDSVFVYVQEVTVI